jgi:hypothetical protein
MKLSLKVSLSTLMKLSLKVSLSTLMKLSLKVSLSMNEFFAYESIYYE